jgi:hypothetical protein
MNLSVRCRCNVQRTIDTSQVGPWRLRCKQCGDVLYDPTQEAAAAEALEASREEEREEFDDSMFQQWLEGSAELKVMMSTDGDSAPQCGRHPGRHIVAACTRCSALLCKSCLDRVSDAFVCSECLLEEVSDQESGGGFMAWLKGLFWRG